VGLSFGCTVGGIIWSFGSYSTHINPAITVAHAFAGLIRQRLLIPYVSFQILGGLLAGLTLRLLFQSLDSTTYLGSTRLGTGISPIAGVVFEAVGTLLLSVVVLATASYVRGSRRQALLVGTTLFILILLIGPLTGASFNPARSLGPSLVSGYLSNHYVYWIGPLTGGVVGAFLFRTIQNNARGKDGRKEHLVCMC